jgi:hypothetical protein
MPFRGFALDLEKMCAHLQEPPQQYCCCTPRSGVQYLRDDMVVLLPTLLCSLHRKTCLYSFGFLLSIETAPVND